MRKLTWRYVATVVLLGTTLAASKATERRRPEELARPLELIPTELAGWSASSTEPLGDDVLQVLRPTSYLSRTYRRHGQLLNLFVAYYAQQRAGESMHSPKNCLPGSGWEVWKYGAQDVPVGGGRVRVNRYSVQNTGERMLVLYWYQSPGRVFASEYWGKLCLMRDAMLTGRTGGSLVRIILPDRPGTVEEAMPFASALIGEMQRCLGG
jgi:EpsI family protein